MITVEAAITGTTQSKTLRVPFDQLVSFRLRDVTGTFQMRDYSTTLDEWRNLTKVEASTDDDEFAVWLTGGDYQFNITGQTGNAAIEAGGQGLKVLDAS